MCLLPVTHRDPEWGQKNSNDGWWSTAYRNGFWWPGQSCPNDLRWNAYRVEDVAVLFGEPDLPTFI